MSRRILLFGTICLLLGFLALPVWPTGAEAQSAWIWSGAVTSSSAVVKAKVGNQASRVRLLLTTADRQEAVAVPETGFAVADDAGVVTFHLQGLEPQTTYQYALEVAGEQTLTGGFQTFADGPMSFRVAFASCAATGSNHRVFSTIRDLQPQFFLHMGDFHYENIRVNDVLRFRQAYDRSLSAPRQAQLYRSTAIAYVWDDHDFGPNNSNRNAAGKPAALRTYQQYVPHYPLSPVEGKIQTIQQAFTVGRVRFIMTDSRAERSPAKGPEGPDKTMLGVAQARWLERQFSEVVSRYPLVVWVNVVPWITKGDEGSGHGWSRYQHERTRFADLLEKLGLARKMVILSGDAHMVAIDDGSHSDYSSDRKPGDRAFPVIQAAPLDRQPSVKGGPYSHGVVAGRGPRRIFREQRFGLMEVQDDGDVLSATFTGYNPEGPIPGMRLTIRCQEDACAPLED